MRKKLNARKAQEGSSQLYLCVLLKDSPSIEIAVVLGTGDKFLTVILPNYGIEKRIYMEDLGLNKFEEKNGTVTLYWPTSLTEEKTATSITQEINILDTLTVRVSTKLSKARPDLSVHLLHPKEVEEHKQAKSSKPTDIKSFSSVTEEDYQTVD